MPAPVLNCPKCSYKVLYNPDFIPTRCPKCHAGLEEARDGTITHFGDAGAPGFEEGTPREILEASDAANFGMRTRDIETRIRKNPVTDTEIQRAVESGNLDKVR